MTESAHAPAGEGASRPTDAELPGLIAQVITEVREALASDRWVVLPNDRMVAAVHAAAGLSHCCVLAEEIVSAHDRGSEMTGRILSRALFETWLVSVYIHHGGVEALIAVGDAYHHSLQVQNEVVRVHDDQLRTARSKVRKRNAKIAKTNQGIEEWNRRHPDQSPKQLHEQIPEPAGVLIGLDLSEGLRRIPTRSPKPLPLMTLVDRLRRLTREAGKEESFDAAYHLAYRGLSSLGAHANLFVLNSYLDDRGGQAILIRLRSDSAVSSSFGSPNLNMALLLTAQLSSLVLGSRDCPCQISDAVLQRFEESFGGT